jgi:hypothetical protein
MRNLLLAIPVMVLSAAAPALAEQPLTQKPAKPAVSAQQLPLKRAGSRNSCAAYGPDFVKVEGSETCVKVGGAVSIGVGGSR